MKKLWIAILMILLLSACETDDEVIITIDCDKYPTHKTCTTDENDDDPIVTEGDYVGNYENLGNGSDVVYTGRDLVPSTCDYLDNIGDWQPVWCDDFEYTGLPNSDLWNYDVGGSGWGNNELQYYTNKDLDNAFVENGLLTIRAIQESYSGNEYTSARLITKDKGDWLYGKIQVRAKVPAGLGTWPAIWMLPTDWVYGGWPSSGEIDIMEYVGYQPNTIHGTIHTGKYNHTLGTQVGVSKTVSTAEEEFHVYEMEWEVGVIRLYIDGTLYASFDYDALDNTDNDSFEAWPFDQRFHLLINLAFGGNWGGAMGVDPDIMPVDFQIDYVRVYQKDYEAMDQSNPEMVANLTALVATSDRVFLTWDTGVDDVLVKQYHILVNGVEVDTTTVNGYGVDNLQPQTQYTFSILAEDFAGNLSVPSVLTHTTPSPPTVNTRVEAEDYNSMVGIQTQTTTDTGGGENVGWVDTNDYMTYVLEVTEAGTYEIDFRIASESAGARFNFYQDTTTLFSMSTSATGGWQNWQTFTSDTFTLQPGTYTFKLLATGSGFNINYFDFRKVS